MCPSYEYLQYALLDADYAHRLYSPAIAELSAFQYFSKYIKYLGPSWFRRFLVRLVPSETVQTIRKATEDIEAESIKILAEKRSQLRAGDKEIAYGISEKKDLMSVLRTHSAFCVPLCQCIYCRLVSAYQLGGSRRRQAPRG